MTAVVRVVVADDSPAFAGACGELVAACDGFELVGTAMSGEDAIARVLELPPDRVLLDVSMPGIGGVEAARAIRRVAPQTAVVLLSADSRLSIGAGDAGAAVVSKGLLTRARLRELWERSSTES
jgi:DNA-binding NarL/FixJ family response regulator